MFKHTLKMNNKEATEEFIRRETVKQVADEHASEESECRREARTEYDAVHPRFQEEKKPEVIDQFQRANDYYCDECKLYFAPDVIALKTHFKEDMVKHRQIGECFYCKGPVYSYRFNNEQKVYHSCETNK